MGDKDVVPRLCRRARRGCSLARCSFLISCRTVLSSTCTCISLSW